jgi:hypothetical protein
MESSIHECPDSMSHVMFIEDEISHLYDPIGTKAGRGDRSLELQWFSRGTDEIVYI